jgi:hypothetical protein
VALGVNFTTTAATYTMADQGTGCLSLDTRAGNVFEGSNTIDIYSGLSTNWKYYAFLSTTNTSQYPYNTSGNLTVNGCVFNTQNDANSPCKNFRPCLDAYVQSPAILKENTGIYRVLLASGLKHTPEAQELLSVIVNGYNDLEDRSGLITFLESLGTDDMRKLLLPLYVESGNYTAIPLTADSLSLHTAEKLAYKQYYNLLADLHSSNRTIKNLTPTEYAMVADWAVDSLEISPYAKTIMSWVNNTPWEHKVEPTPVITLSTKLQEPTISRTEGDRSTLQQAIPNPAMQTARIPVYISKVDAAKKPILVIRNMMGSVMAEYELKEGSQHIAVDVRNFSNGIYTYSLCLNAKQYETYKLSIVH